ncbi:adenylate/guanylate cyclase domain-containing protein [Gordonia terrae]
MIRPEDNIAGAVLALSVISSCVGAGGMALTARSVADPITEIISATARVEEGNYETRVPVYDGSEVGRLQVGFNRMAATVGEREHIRELFCMHVGDAVAARAIEEEPTLGGELRDVAVLFIDLVGSTSLAESHSPDQIVALLNDFFACVVSTDELHDGFVNEFEGDAALVVFGAPIPHDDAPGAALRTARSLSDSIPFDGRLDAGIGVAYGECLAGNVGAANRFEYTVIGDPVNEAARLSDLAKDAPGRTIASSDVVDSAAVDETQHWSPNGSVTLRGRSSPTLMATPRGA